MVKIDIKHDKVLNRVIFNYECSQEFYDLYKGQCIILNGKKFKRYRASFTTSIDEHYKILIGVNSSIRPNRFTINDLKGHGVLTCTPTNGHRFIKLTLIVLQLMVNHIKERGIKKWT